MMDSKYEDGSNKHEATTEENTESSELDPKSKHDGDKPTTEDIVSGLEVYPEAKHDDNNPTTESTVSGSEVHPEGMQDELEAAIGGKNIGLSSSSSSSSSSLSSLSGSPLDLNGGEEDPLDDSFAKSDLRQSPRSECISPHDVSTQTAQWSMVSASPRAGPGNSFSRELLPPTPDRSMYSSSPMKSPLTQSMRRPTGYDPNRIPSSIFSARPATPTDWSVASNESLFSIHMGNSSFSKDHVLMLGDTKQEEWGNVSDFTTNLPPVFEAAPENDKKSTDIREDSAVEEETQILSKTIPAETVEQSKMEKSAPGAQEPHLPTTSSNLSEGKGVTPVDGTPNSVSAARVSNESATSSGSFAFPVLDKNEGQKCGSLKAIAEKPEETQSEPPDPQPPPKEAQTSWFSCFSCWPRCC